MPSLGSIRSYAATTCFQRQTQAFLAELLGYPTPIYAHVPLALNARGERLAKRDGAVTLPELAAQGSEPSTVLGLLRSRWTWHRLANASRPMHCSSASILGYRHASHG